MEFYELIILRHAKSAQDTDALSDFQRPLNKRGKKAAGNIGGWLAKQAGHNFQIVSSPALRAWQTAVAVSHALKIPEQKILFPGELYLASSKEILEYLSKFSDDVKKIILIGHNPGLEELLAYLANDALPASVDGKILPTATLAHLQLEKSWQHLEKGTAKLLKIHRPK